MTTAATTTTRTAAATTGMSFEERSLDTLRSRLTSITASLRDLYNDLLVPTHFLPAWDRILLPCHDLSRALLDLQSFLHNRRAFERDVTDRESGVTVRSEGYDLPAFLGSAYVYPTAGFPRGMENALGGLLTKRRAPMSEAWVDEAIRVARAEGEGYGGVGGGGGIAGELSAQDLQDLWNWAPIEGNSIAREILYGGAEQPDDDDDDDEEDDEDEDEEMEDADGATVATSGKERAEEEKAPQMMPIEDIMRFMTTGALPG